MTVPRIKRLTIQKTIRQLHGNIVAIVETDKELECYFSADSVLLDALKEIFPNSPITSGEIIDWEEQSALHSPFYRDGRIQLPLENGSILNMVPGPAFGDASHPSTRLALKLLSPGVADHSILDIGTGNGVLALSAGILGAKLAVGVEIDEPSLAIAIQNRELNKLQERVALCLPEQFHDGETVFDIVVANMTLGDLRVAFPHYLKALIGANKVILSGLLKGQEVDAMKLLPSHFQIDEEVSEGQWIAISLHR